ncbi:MAG TPA: hypothetical protein VFK03_04210 [Candidatus Saccharimonadales bacterium]|nr:hypothetical protein [Candidatus Saccharimonadales bacterium]
MELLKLATRRSGWSELLYVALNLAYAAALLILVLLFNPPWIAYLIVVLSKWRTFAVRPRYWFANLQANLVDALVVGSFVTLMWRADTNLWLQIILAVLLAVWLTVVKPRSKRQWVLAQALVCQAISLMALFSLSYHTIASVVVVVAWLIGYSAARHALSSYSEEGERTLLSLAWSLIIAELSWLSYHWTIAYTIYDQIKVPEVVVVTSLISFLAIKIYETARSDSKSWLQELRWPTVFVVFIIMTLIILFNGLDPTQL